MPNDSALRARQLIQGQGPHRSLPTAVTPETAALCVLIDELTRELAAVRKRVFRIESGRDCA